MSRWLEDKDEHACDPVEDMKAVLLRDDYRENPLLVSSGMYHIAVDIADKYKKDITVKAVWKK